MACFASARANDEPLPDGPSMSPVDALLGSLRRMRTRWLESGLIVVAVALSVSVLTVVAASFGADLRAVADFEESVFARQGVITSTQDDYSSFDRAGDTPLDVRLVGSIYTPPARFSYGDLAELKAGAPTVNYAYARGFRVFRSEAWDGGLPAAAYSADYLAAARIKVVEGSLPSASDFKEERRVIVMTHRFATILSLSEPIIGRSIEFVGEDAPYVIVGILPPVLDGEPMSVREALVPFSAGRDVVSELWFAVEDPSRLSQAVAEVQAFAQARWEGGAAVSVDRDTALAFLQERKARGTALTFFSGTALVVSACNLLALMLGRVVRRQREIGVARSLGATRLTVSGEVVLESMLLGALGGLLGVAAGRALLAVYNLQLATDPAGYGMHFSFSLQTAVWAAGGATMLAILAGLYPAMIASHVRIVDAVRSD